MTLGKLERVDLRTAWKHEAMDFTSGGADVPFFGMSATHRRGAYIPARDAGTYAPPTRHDRWRFFHSFKPPGGMRCPEWMGHARISLAMVWSCMKDVPS
jgi:hypothetical protein